MPILSQFPTLMPFGVITCTPFFSAVEDFTWTASIQRAPVSRLSSKGKSNTAQNPLSPSMLEPSLTYSPPRGWTGGNDSPSTKNSLVGGGIVTLGSVSGSEPGGVYKLFGLGDR